MEELNQSIINWVQYDNKLKEYAEKSKILRNKKDEISTTILGKITIDENQPNKNLPQFAIEALNTKVMINRSNTYETMSNKFLIECFEEYFHNSMKQKEQEAKDTAEELMKFIKSKRKIEKKIQLKRDYLIT